MECDFHLEGEGHGDSGETALRRVWREAVGLFLLLIIWIYTRYNYRVALHFFSPGDLRLDALYV